MNRREFVRTAALGTLGFGLLPAAQAGSARRVAVDPDGALRMGGRRQFILGLYQLPKRDGAMKEAADAGFNLINSSPTRAAFDEAAEHRLMAWSSLGSLPPSNAKDAEAHMRQTVEALRDHPALLFWETEDEPTFVWKDPGKLRTPADQINAAAAFIRRIDPNHPLYLNHAPTNLVSTLQNYNPAADIVATDIYPVIPPGIREEYALWPDGRQGDFLNATISQVGLYTDKTRAVAGPRRAVFMVLQAFAWENLREKDRDPKMIVYPSLEQLRFMAWSSIIHGANGLIWWGLAFTPEESVWRDLRRVASEIAPLQEALTGRRVRLNLQLRYHDVGHSLDRGVEWCMKTSPKGALLVAVNADGNPVDVTMEGLQQFRRCEPVFGSGNPRFAAGRLREQFEPFGTRAWRLSRGAV